MEESKAGLVIGVVWIGFMLFNLALSWGILYMLYLLVQAIIRYLGSH